MVKKPKFNGEYFFSYKNGVHVDDDYVQQMINEVVDSIMKLDNDNYASHSTGDTIVIAHKYEDEINVVVSQSYIEATYLKDDNGKWYPINYFDEDIEEKMRENLVENKPKYDYNPRREV